MLVRRGIKRDHTAAHATELVEELRVGLATQLIDIITMKAQQQPLRHGRAAKGRRGRGCVGCVVWLLGIFLGVYVAELILHADVASKDNLDMEYLGLTKESLLASTEAKGTKTSTASSESDEHKYIYITEAKCHAHRKADGSLGDNWHTWTKDGADQRCDADHETSQSCNAAKGWCMWEEYTVKVLKMPPPPPSPPPSPSPPPPLPPT